MHQGTYVVTGAAGALGEAVAEALAEARVSLVLADADAAAVAASSKRLSAAGVDARAFPCDVTDEDSMRSLAEAATERGPVRGLVTLAGIYQHGPIDTVSGTDWDRVLDVNLKGTFLACQALMPALQRSGGASIVTISSLAGRTKSLVSAVNYGAAKGGVIGFTMLLAAQVAASAVRVNCVAPGHIATPMFHSIPQAARDEIVNGIPMGRVAEPREVADAIVYLLSKRSSFITGQTLNVNGGVYM
ncbi:SDR family NAD(P)-dependent oxidoreductase [Dactylosporangium sp. NPDC005572]|uniref:SDR family oxidoreductase n=1 Tax=Dactylosporangium sp. NPDC005572 TaxID=3156889 RepID=UPI0033B218A1